MVLQLSGNNLAESGGKMKRKVDLKDFNMSIDISCSADYDLSRFNFEENFQILQHNSKRKPAILFYNYGNIIEFSVDFWKLTKKELVECINEEGVTIKERKEYLIDCLTSYNKDYEILIDLPDNIIEKLGFEVLTSTGYSQGDYSNIIIDVAQF